MSSLGFSTVFAAPERHPQYEPVDYGNATSAANLFANAETSASSQWENFSPDRAVNGNLDPSDHWAAENIPVWHQVDLGKPTEIGALHVWPYWGDGRIYQYKVEGSLDGKQWQMLGDMTANSIASSPEGHGFQFQAAPYRYVRTTFLKNSTGDARGGHLVEIAGYAAAPQAELVGGIGTTDLRYPPQGPIAGLESSDKGIRLQGWRGERVNAQVVLQSDLAHENVHFEPLVLQNGETSIQGTARFVRYTLARGKPYGDILDTAASLAMPSGSNRPIWLEVNIPAGIPAGNYTGTFVVRSNSSQVRFPIRLEVANVTLPPPSEWLIHLDLWQHPQAVARYHGVPEWSEAHFALLKPSMRRLAEAGQKTITTSLIHEPWEAQTYDWFPSMIEWRKRADGSWHYNYEIFDRWVAFMSDECGYENARIHGYTMIPWSLKFRYFDEASGALVDERLVPGTDAYDAFWGAFLRDFSRHLESKGWLKRMRIGVDERPDALMRGALATLKKHAPEIRVASAINHPSDLVRDVDDISPIIMHSEELKGAALKQRRDAGLKTTFYVCTGPEVPNTFTYSPPAEAEWLPLYASANGFDGFLRWAFHSWVKDPLVATDFTSWQPGDCFLVYPGDRSSVRFERLRDGIESFEKIRLLREDAQKNPSSRKAQAMERLDEALANFTWQHGKESGVHADDVARVNQALQQATDVVTGVNR